MRSNRPDVVAPDHTAVAATRRIFVNLSRLLGGKAGAGLISLVYLVIAARSLGSRDYGVLVLVHGYVLAVGGIVCFPGWHAVVRYGADALLLQDIGRLARLMRFTAKVEFAAGALAIMIAALLAPAIGPVLGWSPAAQSIAPAYCLAIVGLLRTTPAGYLQLMARFDLLGWHNIVMPMVRLLGALIASFLSLGLTGFLVAWLVAAAAEWISLWLMAWFVWHGQHADHARPVIRGAVQIDNPGLWKFMIGANADITFAELAGRIAPLTVGWILGPAAAGLFSIAQRSTVVLTQSAVIMGQASYAELARLAVQGTQARAIGKSLARTIGVSMLAAIPVVGVLAFMPTKIVTLLGGASFASAAPLLVWLGVSQSIFLAGPPMSATLVALGEPAKSVAANLIGNLAVFPALPLLLLTIGLQGAAWHAILQALVSTALLVWFVRQSLKAHGGPCAIKPTPE